MKRGIFVLTAVLLAFSQSGHARQNTGGGSCTSKNDVPGHFVNQCTLAGGTEVRCSSGTPMCCIKDSQGTRCYDDTNDVKRLKGRLRAGQPTPGRLAPPSSKPRTAPKQPAPGAIAPKP